MHIVFQTQPAPRRRNRHYLVLAFSIALFIVSCCYALILEEHFGWDAHISDWFQLLRTPQLDQMMMLITMMADLYFSVVVIAGLFLLLISRAHWWLGIYLICIFLGTSLGVSITKSLTQRPRPALSETALTLMSFPSGHAARAFLVFGVTALLLSWGRGAPFRMWAFIIACGLSATVAVSRIYLSVHWASDVIASAALAASMLTAFDWQLRLQEPAAKFHAALPLAAFLFLFSAYYLLFVDQQAMIYGITGV